jgi:hypothetical protein
MFLSPMSALQRITRVRKVPTADSTHAPRQEKAVPLLRRHGRAMAAMTRLAAVDQLLRKALAVLDASGTADGFDNLGGRNIMDKIS